MAAPFEKLLRDSGFRRRVGRRARASSRRTAAMCWTQDDSGKTASSVSFAAPRPLHLSTDDGLRSLRNPAFRAAVRPHLQLAATRVALALYAAAARLQISEAPAQDWPGHPAVLGIAASGSLGLASPRSAAVPGMNCAIPRAPTGLMASGWKLLSQEDESGQKRDREMLGERRGIDNPANGGDERLCFLPCERRKSARQGQDKSREG